MTVTNIELKQQYNRMLGQIIDLEEAGKSASNPKYFMLTSQAVQLYQMIASQESIFDIQNWDDSVAFFTKKGERFTFLYGFETNNIKYPLLQSENLRQKWNI